MICFSNLNKRISVVELKLWLKRTVWVCKKSDQEYEDGGTCKRPCRHVWARADTWRPRSVFQSSSLEADVKCILTHRTTVPQSVFTRNHLSSECGIHNHLKTYTLYIHLSYINYTASLLNSLWGKNAYNYFWNEVSWEMWKFIFPNKNVFVDISGDPFLMVK